MRRDILAGRKKKNRKSHMCKSKRRSDGVEPISTTPPRSSRSPKFSLPSRTPEAFLTRHSPAAMTAVSGRSDEYSIRSSSISSITSLLSFQSSLPQTPLLFDFSEIRSATKNFLAATLSSSAAWRCSVRGRDAVVLRRKLLQPVDSLRLHRRLTLICRAHHSSLVKLAGAAISGDHVYLVYDYVHGSNLANCLRNPKNPRFSILSSWISRVQIATDLAHGLDYIHNHAVPDFPLIHNQIKSTGVIVTEPSLRAKICDFGASYLSGETLVDEIDEDSPYSSSSKLKSRVFQGTRGYMSPEFMDSGVGSQKSDVFAFGVVMLELLSGQEPLRYEFDESSRCYRRISVTETAREAIGGGDGDSDGSDGGGRVRRWVDRRMRDSFPVSVARKMARLALECVDEDPNKRPEMGRVAGKVSKFYLKSKIWSESMRTTPADLTVSFAPR